MNEWWIYARKKVCRPNRYFLLVFAVGFIVMSYLNINFLCAKDSLWKYKGLFLVLIKKQKQKETKFFDAEILSA